MRDAEKIHDNAIELVEEMDAYHDFAKGEFDSWGNPTVYPDHVEAEDARKRALTLARAVVRDLVANSLGKQNES